MLLIYGAAGYTGELVSREAVARGLRPVLGGRHAGALVALAAELHLDHQVFALDDAAAVDAALTGARVVLNCAGPFSHTAAPLAAACLRAGAHYLDITGEISVFEALASLDAQARAAGVMLLPGAGFDVVPTDCLAVHLAGRLPGATELRLAFETRGGGGWSRGTARTALEGLGHGGGGVVRRAGKLTAVPAAWKTRRIDFGRGPVVAVTIPWGDVATAWHSTGIPDIEVYLALGRPLRLALCASRALGRVLASALFQRLGRRWFAGLPPGPDAEARARGETWIWGEVRDAAGHSAVSRLHTPEAYALTAVSAVALAGRALAGEVHPGYQTPAKAYGADFVLTLPGVRRWDSALQ